MVHSVTVSKKIWICISILMLGYFGSMILGLINGRNTNSQLVNVSEYIFPASRQSQVALTSFKEQIKLYQDSVILGDEELFDQTQAKSDEAEAALESILGLEGIDKESRDKLNGIIGRLKSFTSSAQPVYLSMAKSSEDGGVSVDAEELKRLSKETDTLKRELSSLTEGFASNLKQKLAATGNDVQGQQTLNLVVFLVVAIAAVSLTWIIVRRFISIPIRQTVAMLKDIAEGEGDLTKRMEVKTNDEIGEMGSWFNTFVEKIQTIIKEISFNSETLQTSASSLNESSDFLATSAEKMTSKANTVTGASEDMSLRMTSVSAASEEASTNLNSVAGATEQLTATISEIAKRSEMARSITAEAVEKTQGASEQMHRLGVSANEIGNVTEVITDISGQTNLLALNATIEAARAGEAGKGFAVVANEIKELAKQTADATQVIKDQIEGIQSTTSDTVQKISEITTVINNINEIVGSIASSVEEQSVTTQEIAGNINHAARGIDDVNENVSSSSALAQEISGDILELNTSASDISNISSQVNLSTQELFKLSEELKSMVEKFRV